MLHFTHPAHRSRSQSLSLAAPCLSLLRFQMASGVRKLQPHAPVAGGGFAPRQFFADVRCMSLHRSSSNIPAADKAAIALLFAIVHRGPGLPERGRWL